MRMDKLTSSFQKALADAQSLAVGRDHNIIEPAHVLMALLDQQGGSSRPLLAQSGVNVPLLRERLGEALAALPKVSGQAGNLSMGNDLSRLLNATDKLAQAKVDHIDQSNESDLNFITQLAEEYDALCAIKNGYLIFITKGAAATVSGMDIPPVIITRASGDQHDFSVDDTDQYTGVTAKWHDHGKAKKQSVHVKKRAKKADAAKSKGKTSKGKKTNGGEVIEGSKDNVKVLRHTYPNKEAATRAAIAEWKRLQRGVADFSYTLARGDLSIISEAPASISGLKPVIDERRWLIKELTHTLSDAGLVTQMQLESVLMGEFDVTLGE